MENSYSYEYIAPSHDTPSSVASSSTYSNDTYKPLDSVQGRFDLLKESIQKSLNKSKTEHSFAEQPYDECDADMTLDDVRKAVLGYNKTILDNLEVVYEEVRPENGDIENASKSTRRIIAALRTASSALKLANAALSTSIEESCEEKISSCKINGEDIPSATLTKLDDAFEESKRAKIGDDQVFVPNHEKTSYQTRDELPYPTFTVPRTSSQSPQRAPTVRPSIDFNNIPSSFLNLNRSDDPAIKLGAAAGKLKIKADMVEGQYEGNLFRAMGGAKVSFNFDNRKAELFEQGDLKSLNVGKMLTAPTIIQHERISALMPGESCKTPPPDALVSPSALLRWCVNNGVDYTDFEHYLE